MSVKAALVEPPSWWMRARQAQWDQRSVSLFHVSLAIDDVMHISLSRGAYFLSPRLCFIGGL